MVEHKLIKLVSKAFYGVVFFCLMRETPLWVDCVEDVFHAQHGLQTKSLAGQHSQIMKPVKELKGKGE